MMVLRFITVAAVVAALSACAVVKVPEALGGSRSDGTVELGYEYGAFEVPKVDMATALETAKKRCAAWGYNNAEAFGGQKNSCLVRDSMGSCTRMQVTITYQCLGQGNTPAS